MRKLIAGNWKMNGLTAHSVTLARAIADGAGNLGCEMAVFPPFTQLAAVAGALSGSAVELGGQDCHEAEHGPYTGDISPAMLRDVGAHWVILGHSERRHGHGELDEQVRRKAVAAAAAGLTPIVCVGETAEARAAGRETEIVGWQIERSLPGDFTGVVAYEPIWAIGSGRTATPEDALMMHGFIREELGRQLGPAGRLIRILYGGSVLPANAASLLAVANVDGALVGGASLEAASFLAIAQAGHALSSRTPWG